MTLKERKMMTMGMTIVKRMSIGMKKEMLVVRNLGVKE